MSDKHQNVAAVLYGICDLRVEPIELPTPAPGQVLLQVQSVGICGSDDHYLRHGKIGSFVCRAPMVLGHEASAVVTSVGEGVTSLTMGDRVAVEPGVPCSACEVCRHGRYNLCPDVEFAATPPVHGSLARYIVHPAQFCYKIPDDMSFDVAALLEPLSVGIHATRRANVAVGHTVLVAGCGTVGLVSIVAARKAGAEHIVATDIDDARLEVARSLGADVVCRISADSKPEELARNLQADACIECSGAEASARLCIYAAKPGTTVVLVGMGKPEMTLPLLDALCREVDIRGIFRYCNTYPQAIKLASSTDLSPLVTHRFSLESAKEAFDAFASPAVASIKIVIDCSLAKSASSTDQPAAFVRGPTQVRIH